MDNNGRVSRPSKAVPIEGIQYYMLDEVDNGLKLFNVFSYFIPNPIYDMV